MEMIGRNFKKTGIIIVALLLSMVGIIFFTNRTYSASDVLGDYADLNAENPFVSIDSLYVENEDKFTSIDMPEETQQALIEAFKNAKFKRVTDTFGDFDYRINITFNTGYPMYVETDTQSLILIKHDGQYEHYSIVNDTDFFKILKNATEKNSEPGI
ncbi:hypothetical protein ACIQ2D_21220 [Lysinibacillus sp. NPDC097287]|uniref:hypothetical protein n=1 Tax=Lysinibacillus sp. NPDC097287 TaxID=3364144 RepID=UPI00381731A6